MGITAVTTPASNTVATRPVVWELTSNSPTIVRLILVVTDTVNTISTIEQNPEPGTTGVFKFNISSVLSDQLSFTPSNALVTGVIPSTISQDTAFIKYAIRAYEVLADGTTTYPGASDYISIAFYSHNYILTHKEWVKPFLLSDYDMETGTGKSFLTNSADTKCITKGYSEYLAMHRVQNDAVFVRDYYDGNDVFLFTQRNPVVNKAGSIEFDDQYGAVTGLGLPGSGEPGDLLAGVVGAYCLVYIENSDLSVASEVKKYIFKEQCGEDIQIHWENKFGAQDSRTFKGRIVRGFNHKSKNYLKPNGNIITSTSRGSATLSNSVEHTFDVYSKSIPRSEVNWIQEMFINKRAWTEEDGHLLPIIIENGSVIESDSENGIYNISFSFSYANLTDGSRG